MFIFDGCHWLTTKWYGAELNLRTLVCNSQIAFIEYVVSRQLQAGFRSLQRERDDPFGPEC